MNKELPQRKHPVHMPPVEKRNMPVVLFVTLAVKPRAPVFDNAKFQDAFRTAVVDANAWRVTCYVLMPDPIHLFAVPERFPAVSVGVWTEYLKRRITSRLGPHPHWDWLPGCWDTQMRSQAGYEEKLSYVRQNPVRAGLTDSPEAWPWRGSGKDVVW
jgi:REP element-mobilizing transposase RayT